MSKASEDFPEPLGPVITTSFPRGMRRSKFFRLCSRAPFTWMCVAASMIANLKRIQKRPGANAIGRFSVLVAALAVLASLPRAVAGEPPAVALRDGESLTYNVRWGLIPTVGRIRISADAIRQGGESVLRVTTTTWTRGPARAVFPFDGRGESIYDAKSGLLLSSSEWSTYRNKEVKNSVIFDYVKMTATFTDDIHPEKSHVITIPNEDPSDLILALINTRFWDLKPGASRDTLVIFEDQIYPLTIRPEPDPDTVFTAMGFFTAQVLVPRMEKTAPIGMFKRGSTVRVWIETDDARRLPVRFEVGFRFGTGTATLIEYQPPK